MLNLLGSAPGPDKLQLVTSAAVTVDVVASYMDYPPTTPGVQCTAITTATTTDIVAAPGAAVFRTVKTMTIRNKHATTPVDVTVVYNHNGVQFEKHKCTLRAQECLELIEGTGFFALTIPVLPLLMRSNDADLTGSNVATAQPWFPTAGGVTVVAATTYYFTGLLILTRAAGTTSHTTSLLFGGTATLSSINWSADVNSGDVQTTTATQRTSAQVATANAIKAADIVATETISMMVAGIVRINAGGTFIPQFQYSVAPGGAPTTKAGSYFRLEPVGANTNIQIGTWA
jgi:hypothetical protein